MRKSELVSNNWKNDQLTIFKKYIKNFKPGSVEYTKLEQGIRELESNG